MRRTFTIIIGVALVAAACGPQAVTQEEPSTASTTTTAPSLGTVSTPDPAIPPLDGPPTEGSGPVAVGSDATPWVYEEWSVPPDIDPYRVVWGDPGMVVLGYFSAGEFDDSPVANGLWLFDGDTWSRTLLRDVTIADEYGFTPEVTDLVWFGGRYLAFLMGDSTTTPGRASMLTSTDGINWTLEYLGRAPAAALPAGLYATPESPPYPGTSAVTRASIYGNQITVAGWTVLESGPNFLSVPMVWRSSDGSNWSSKALPNANFDNEWASDVAVGPLGYLVEVAGPVHQSAYLWYSPDGEEWTYVGDRFDDQWRGLVSIAVGEQALLAVLIDLENDGGQSLSVWRATNGLDWEQVEAPFAPDAPADRYPPADLAATGQGIVVLVAGEGSTHLWQTADGLSWTELSPIVLPAANPLVRITRAVPEPVPTGSGLAMAIALPGKVARWSDVKDCRSVVLVAPDDVLNVRSGPGVENEIIAGLSPTATGVMLTGRRTVVGSSIWVEIVIEHGTGWVNEHYLAEQD